MLRTKVGRSDWLRRDVWEQFVLPRCLERSGVALYHGLDYGAPIRAGRFLRVVTFYDALAFSPIDDRHPVVKARIRFLIRQVARSVDAIVTISDYSRQELLRHLDVAPERIVTVWCGISETFFGRCRPDEADSVIRKLRFDDPFILYYGGFGKRKNVEALVRAFARVRKVEDCRLVLAGPGDGAFAGLGALIRALGLEQVVTRFGFASEEELRALLALCRLFVFPSLYEGFGLPIAEAMACGAPVLSSRAGALAEIAGEGALLVDAKEPATLAEAMLSALGDAVLLESLRVRGRERAQQFRWRHGVERLGKLYCSLVDGRRAGCPG